MVLVPANTKTLKVGYIPSLFSWDIYKCDVYEQHPWHDTLPIYHFKVTFFLFVDYINLLFANFT